MYGDIPYIRITRSIPREMRDKLPQEYLSMIETTVCAPVLFLKDHLLIVS